MVIGLEEMIKIYKDGADDPFWPEGVRNHYAALLGFLIELKELRRLADVREQ